MKKYTSIQMTTTVAPELLTISVLGGTEVKTNIKFGDIVEENNLI